MSQGTFLETLIRLEAFKRIFVFCPKIDFSLRGFCSKMCKFWSRPFSLVYVPWDVSVSQNALGNHF